MFDFCTRLKNPVTSTAGTMKQLTSFLAYDTHSSRCHTVMSDKWKHVQNDRFLLGLTGESHIPAV